jgi:hypothetical protein
MARAALIGGLLLACAIAAMPYLAMWLLFH